MSTARETVYATLKERIIEGDLHPGQRLIERDLAAELEVSRVPVREALGRLEAERLVVLVPRQGVLVSPFTPQDVADFFDVRESLEVLAARLTAQRADGNGLAALRAVLDQADEATRRRDARAIALANAAFHTAVVALSGNALLVDMMRPLEARLRWLFRLTHYDPEQQCAEHHELYQAIAAHDSDAAADQVLRHIHAGRARSVELAATWTAVDPVAATRTRRRRT
ncbi:GntR family transcriptional regulator [Nonomuraea endophytica]|uniref:DNA-binding GntR family transcriptional regulator n=1 Tax=Nonomuraea endophytica TaxID=714136 RepID=A0A7W8A8J0_9ACTN|nr:GntR family transcriptional regulator [Nonomuraea endophytica]MBB5080586.1 DNA-binding GntR family transcriptional regulator [Nonomuraea endophytica]